MSYPGLLHIPDLADARPANTTVRGVLDQVAAALATARQSLHELECCGSTISQLALIRQIVIECRRSTFVLQKLASRVEGWDDWYGPVQQEMRADPLMQYFHDLRNEIEKEGLPSPMAEVYDPATGEVLADVRCWEDRHGLAVTGAARPGCSLEPGELSIDHGLRLRNFQLPDPPLTHLGQPLADLRFAAIAAHAIEFLTTKVLEPAEAAFGATNP